MIRYLNITDYMPSENDTIWDVRDAPAYNEGHIEYAKNQREADGHQRVNEPD